MGTSSWARGALLLAALSTHALAGDGLPTAGPGTGGPGTTGVPPAPGSEAGPPATVAPDALVLPQVVVPLPERTGDPSTPPRRDPTAALEVVEVRSRRGEARDTAAFLAEVPGLHLQQLGGFGQLQTLALRGASSTGVQVLLDGVPLNGAGGTVDLSRLPAASIQRLEVLRGGAGSRYGSGALGGVVNVVTRAPRAAPRVDLEATWGSFGTALLQASATGPLLGGEALLLLHGARSEGNFPFRFDPTPLLPDNADVERRTRENNDAALGGALARYRRGLGQGLTLDALAEVTLDARGLAGTPVFPTPEERLSNRRATASARLTRQWEGGELGARVFARADSIHVQGASPEQGTFALAGMELDGSTLLDSGGALGAHGLSAHLSLHHESYRSASAGQAWLRAAVSLMDEWMVLDGAVTLVPSLRLEQAGPYTLLSPKFGLGWELPWGLRLLANAGQSHRAPAFIEAWVPHAGMLPNPNLKPERALSADVGLVHRTEWTRVSATGFAALYENLISYEFYVPLPPRPYNFASASAGGLEVAASASPGEWLAASASYTLTLSRNLRDDPRYLGKELPYRPRHRGMVRVEAGPRVLRGRVQVEGQSAQWVNRVGSAKVDARALLSAGLTGRLPAMPGLALSLELRNLTDVQAQDFNGYPLPGRSAFLTLAVALGDGAEGEER